MDKYTKIIRIQLNRLLYGAIVLVSQPVDEIFRRISGHIVFWHFHKEKVKVEENIPSSWIQHTQIDFIGGDVSFQNEMPCKSYFSRFGTRLLLRQNNFIAQKVQEITVLQFQSVAQLWRGGAMGVHLEVTPLTLNEGVPKWTLSFIKDNVI